MKVRVTAEDIAKGQRRNAEYCPIARALKRKTKKAVAACEKRIWIGYRMLPHTTTKEAREFMERFDSSKPVKPGWIEVWK